LTRGLGISFRFGELVSASLWDREAWYLSHESEPMLPTKERWKDRQLVPEGWHYAKTEKLTKKIRESQKEVGPLFTEMAWKPMAINEEGDETYRNHVLRNTSDWYAWRNERSRNLKKRSRLLGLSCQNTVRYLRPVLTDDLRRRMGEFRLLRHVYLKKDNTPPRRPVTFDQDDEYLTTNEVSVFLDRGDFIEYSSGRAHVRFAPPPCLQ